MIEFYKSGKYNFNDGCLSLMVAPAEIDVKKAINVVTRSSAENKSTTESVFDTIRSRDNV